MFNELVKQGDRQRFMALGAVTATYRFSGVSKQTVAIVDLDAQVVTDGGLSFVNTISVSLLKDDVGSGDIGASVDTPLGNFELEGLITEDHSIIQFYAKKYR